MAASDSPELRTLKACTPQLETALKGLDSGLVHFLNHNSFITDDVMDNVRNPVTMLNKADKAWELVRWIKNRVKQDPPSYHVLLERLKQSGNLYKPIVKILEAEYARQNPQGASSGGIDPARDRVSLGSSASVQHPPSRDAVDVPSLQTQNTSLGGAGVAAHLPSATPTNGHRARQIHGASLIPSTSPAAPRGTRTLPCHDIPTYEDYRRCIPEENRWKLDKKLDFERDNVDLHLGELAMVFDKWEDISPLLGLTDTDVSDIIKDCRTQADQRRAALKKWKSKFGFHATYGTLLKACLRKESLNCAEKIVILLGAAGGPTLGSPPSSSHSSPPQTYPPSNPPSQTPLPRAYPSSEPQPPLPPSPHQPSSDPHILAMQQLVAMGFVDETLNSSLLLRYNNDISSVVGELVRISPTSALETAPTREAHFDTISTQNVSQPHVNQATAPYTNQHYSPAMPHSTSPSGGYPQATVDRHPHTDSMDSQAAQHFVDGPQHHSNGGRKHLGMSADQPEGEHGLNEIDGITILSKKPGKYQNRVEKVISDLTPQQVFKLGQELGLYHSTLKKMPLQSIHGDMVQTWLTKMDDVPEVGGDPTWRSFAHGLAELRLWGPVDIIRERYPSVAPDSDPSYPSRAPVGASYPMRAPDSHPMGASYPPRGPTTTDQGKSSSKRLLNHGVPFELKHILAALDSVVSPKKYVRLGVNLGLGEHEVERMEEDQGRNCERVLIGIITLWMRNVTNPKPSWESLEEALRLTVRTS